jgi:hypothetical protein
LWARGLLHLRSLSLPAREQLAEFLVELDELGWGGGNGHDGGPGLHLLARLVVLFCVLREVGEVGLEAAHVTRGRGRSISLPRASQWRMVMILTLHTPWQAVACLPRACRLPTALPVPPCPGFAGRRPL